MARVLVDGISGLQAWPGLLVIVGLAFMAMGADLARHERDGF
ncbi:MAG TPA: hypothetical protein VIP52_05860 [Candidatus Dormibacteraeota bacterium]|jgi:hypothetical protein